MSQQPYIVCIDDDRATVNLICKALEPIGYDVLGVTNGALGMTKIRDRRPDLVLLDLNMPDVNGYDVYSQMKQDDELADVPVIVITSSTDSTIDGGIVAGLPPTEDYIVKPFKLIRLRQAVRATLSVSPS